MSETSTLIGYSGRTIGREELALVPTPAATETHRPVPHHEIVQALIETLGFRHIGVVHDEYAVSPDGMKMFGVLDLASEMEGCRFSIGLRNSHDKSMRLAMTCGYRVFVCSNMAFSGDFTPVLAKHSKSFSLIDCVSVGVDRMQPELSSDAKAGGNVAEERVDGRDGQSGHLRSICGGQARSSQTSRPNGPRPLLQADVRGIPVANLLEPLECVHLGIQATGPHPAIQGNGEARRVSGDSVLAVVLKPATVPMGPRLLN